MFDASALQGRLAGVRERIARAADRARRDPSSVHLIAVSKTFDADHVRAAADAGQIDFGENKVQEAIRKMDQLGDLPLRWHLIGHLQSNKVNKAGSRFDTIHSVDQIRLVEQIEQVAAAAARRLTFLVQVDLADEPTKHGADRDALPSLCRAASGLPHASMVGLMLLPPASDDPDQSRPYFRALATLRDDLLAQGVDRAQLGELSMGMSHDFEVAVEEGATLVRVGTAIFGSRLYV